MVDQFTKGQLSSEIWQKWELKTSSNPKNRPGNVCRKYLQFPAIPGNLNWWNSNITLMTIKEAYLVALRATINVTYVPVMTPGLLWHVSCQSWDISWPYWMVSWAIFGENMVILVQISSYIMARKCIRMRGKYVIWSRKPFWGFRKRTTRHIEGLLLPRKCS